MILTMAFSNDILTAWSILNLKTMKLERHIVFHIGVFHIVDPLQCTMVRLFANGIIFQCLDPT